MSSVLFPPLYGCCISLLLKLVFLHCNLSPVETIDGENRANGNQPTSGKWQMLAITCIVFSGICCINNQSCAVDWQVEFAPSSIYSVETPFYRRAIIFIRSRCYGSLL
jgi:hypothetical protein